MDISPNVANLKMSDDSTHHLMEPRGVIDIPTTIKTMLQTEPRPVSPDAHRVFPARSRSRAFSSSSQITGGMAATSDKAEPPSESEAIRGRTTSRAEGGVQKGDRPSSSCRSTSPLIRIVSEDEMEQTAATKIALSRSSVKGKETESTQRRVSLRPRKTKDDFVLLKMAYNEYGELVDERTLNEPARPEDLSITQLLRVIKKAYHHDVSGLAQFLVLTYYTPKASPSVMPIIDPANRQGKLRDKLGKIIVPQGDGKDSVLVESFVSKDRLTSWDFKSHHSKSPNEQPTENTPADSHNVPVYNGPPHTLEIGCSDGAWCHNFKKEMPDWIVEGVDDTNHWSCGTGSDAVFKDFMTDLRSSTEDYFSRVRLEQTYPEFTVRNINMLLNHTNPMLHNVYEFIRGREIFDRVENYRTFLDDIRLMLKPDGVVEFLEIDPRPRAIVFRREGVSDEHKSCPQTNWTDNIEDRFRDPFDEELATTVPGWSERVAERLKATLRHRDGVAAANLTSWLEGAGFWDVKQFIIPVPVGGNSRPGQRLKEYILYQIGLEDSLPKLKEGLPKVEVDTVETGEYHINIHVVTGRKPHVPRPGDLLQDGKRQDMTESRYDAMARFKAMKVTPWKRYEIGSNIAGIIENLKSLPGAPELLSKESEEGVTELLHRSQEFQDAVTLEEPASLGASPVSPGVQRAQTALTGRRKAGLSGESRADLTDRSIHAR